MPLCLGVSDSLAAVVRCGIGVRTATSNADMLNDLRHSLRFVYRSPALTLAAVCTLAMAIGANTAVFSVVDKVLVRPLPIDDPDRVVVMWSREPASSGGIGEFSYVAFRSWQAETRAFDTLAAIGSVNWSLVLREGDPVTLPVAAVSASFFPLMGTPAALGRTLQLRDDERGGQRVAVMSHRAWVRRFGADTAIVGRALRFDDGVYTIVGVMPDGFDYPRGAELWVPLVPAIAGAGADGGVDLLSDPGIGFLFVLGRIRPGVTIAAARDELSATLARGGGTLFRPGEVAVVTPLAEHIFGTTRPALIALAAGVALVLLIGCANVAVLLLARAVRRSRETAIRLAIGAKKWHIVRQSLADALLLSVLGAAGGLALAYWSTDVLVAIAPADVPRLDAVRFDARTLVFACMACLVTTVLIGLAPGLQSAQRQLTDVAGHAGSRVTRSRVRSAFVIAQVALALVVLVCGGLVVRSFVNLLRVDMGFEPVDVLTLDVTVPDVPADRYNRFYTELLARVDAMPAVDAAGAIFLRPLAFTAIGSDVTILIEGQRTDVESRDSGQNPTVNFQSVTPGYFDAAGIRVLRGRSFSERDVDAAPLAVIVSAGLAQRLWPGRDPIGRRILPRDTPADVQGRQRWSTVIGVVEDVRYRGITDPRFDLYVPYLQRPTALVKHLMVRTSGEPLSLVDAIRAEAREIEPGVLIENITTMDHLVDRAMSPWRFGASMLSLLGLLALALASTGVYATVSQSVADRTHEMGVRVAVGARPRQIAGLVLGDGLRVAAAGIAVGLGVAIAAGRVLTSLLYEVHPGDPLTLAAMAALFTVVSIVALAFPTWRATRVDPMLALREQ